MSCDDKLMDEVLELLIEKAAPIAEEHLEYAVDDRLEFSEKHKREMRRLFRKERSRQRRSKFTRYAGRTVAGVAAFVVVSSAVLWQVDAVKVRILNFALEEYDDHTDINFLDQDGNPPENANYEIYENKKMIVNYVPEGFTLESDTSKDLWVNLRFSSGDKILYILRDPVTAKIGFDSEDTVKENMTVNGMEAVFYYKELRSTLIWHDNQYLYTITSNLDKNEIMKIAEQIENKI